jgi:hypothetical protein
VLVVDTNVLVYAADTASPHHRACRRWLEDRRSRHEAWFITWGIVYEFLRVVTHPRVLRRPWGLAPSLEFVDGLVNSPSAALLVATERHADVLRETAHEFDDVSGNLLHDLHTVVLMREHGISRICTRDTDYHRFPFLTVIDPLRA